MKNVRNEGETQHGKHAQNKTGKGRPRVEEVDAGGGHVLGRLVVLDRRGELGRLRGGGLAGGRCKGRVHVGATGVRAAPPFVAGVRWGFRVQNPETQKPETPEGVRC